MGHGSRATAGKTHASRRFRIVPSTLPFAYACTLFIFHRRGAPCRRYRRRTHARYRAARKLRKTPAARRLSSTSHRRLESWKVSRTRRVIRLRVTRVTDYLAWPPKLWSRAFLEKVGTRESRWQGLRREDYSYCFIIPLDFIVPPARLRSHASSNFQGFPRINKTRPSRAISLKASNLRTARGVLSRYRASEFRRQNEN